MVTKHMYRCKDEVLFALIKQREQEKLKMEMGYLNSQNPVLKVEIRNLQILIQTLKGVIVRKNIMRGISITDAAKKLCTAQGLVEKEVYGEVFKLKVLDGDGMISTELSKRAIDRLPVQQLMDIIHLHEHPMYVELASRRFDEIIFDVDSDVLDELDEKIEMDIKEKCKC